MARADVAPGSGHLVGWVACRRAPIHPGELVQILDRGPACEAQEMALLDPGDSGSALDALECVGELQVGLQRVGDGSEETAPRGNPRCGW